jgi:hypothetical protein
VSAHGHELLDWRDDFLQQQAYVTPGHVLSFFPVNRAYAEYGVRPRDGLPGSLGGELFFIATGIWPLPTWSPPRPLGLPCVLDEVAQSADYARVRPYLELVDGRYCHVLEHEGRDHLWLDAASGCSLVAREIMEREKESNRLAQRFELRGHREVAAGVWLPSEIRSIQFDYTAPTEEGRRRRVKNTLHVVLEAAANCVDESAFRFTVPPGAWRKDDDGTGRQDASGGEDHLDELAGWVRRHGSLREAVAGKWATAVAALLGAAVFIGAAELLRALRAHTS